MSTKSDRMYITKNDAVTITAKFDGDMYVMDMKGEKPAKCYSVRKDDLRTLHRRMEHVNVTKLLRTAKLGAVVGLERVEATPKKFTSDTCNLEK